MKIFKNRIGESVKFKSPKAAEGKAVQGKIIDSVGLEPIEWDNWGWYRYTSELIEWADGSRTIRSGYYHYHPRYAGWRWGQYSPEDKPEVIKRLLEVTLAQGDWFRN